MWGLSPELGLRGVEVRLLAVHGERRMPCNKWKLTTTGIWVTWPMPKPGKRIALDSHSHAGVLHPLLLDGAHCSRGYTASSRCRLLRCAPP